MGMTVSITCDREGCREVSPDGSADDWFSVRRGGETDVWLCSVACLQRWAASV